MSSTPIREALAMALASPSPSPKTDADFTAANFELDGSLSEEERRFYLKLFPTIDMVNQRKLHCTVCRVHMGSAAGNEDSIKMHPILRVTHCVKCHDFYNSGEFSKGEDGSELYCRWCGQGGEVYCCSSCPFVFCKSCIIKNLSRGVIVDIEQNENWNCFSCTSKILWPLRAQHWALINYIDTQKKAILALKLPEPQLRKQLARDHSTCCRLAKSKASSMSDSQESLESNASKRSLSSAASSAKKLVPKIQTIQTVGPPAKRIKTSIGANDEVVCTPDLLSMLEPDCQISVPPAAATSTPKATQLRALAPAANLTTTPRIITVQQNYTVGASSSANASSSSAGPRSSVPPPLVLSSGVRYRQSLPAAASPPSLVRRTVVPNAVRNAGPVFHTINGFRVDLNSAAQQDSYRLPNGRLIQVKRQVPPGQSSTPLATPLSPQVVMRVRAPPPPPSSASIPTSRPSPGNSFGSNMGIYNPTGNPTGSRPPQVMRLNNGTQIQAVPSLPASSVATASAVAPFGNAAPATQSSNNGAATAAPRSASGSTPSLVRHVFAPTAIGQARTQLQEQIFNAMEICQHLTGKVQTLTHSNAYTQARSYLDLKELYIHLSYLMTYAIGRFKGLQDKCLTDMRDLGFINDANSLENGQLAAAVDYVCYGQLDDVDLFNTGCNSFHNQVYEYRKSLHSNLKDGEAEPLPPLLPLGVRNEGDPKEGEGEEEDNDNENENEADDDLDYDDQDESNADNDADDDLDNEDSFAGYESTLGLGSSLMDTEESMNRNEQAHAYDRKLTRLLREYPSIWCTRHPDYGKMEVTKKQWRVIASHFQRGDNIKLRWKNIRKRYVRIERRLKQGKRFKGYFDKATNYLANRDLPRGEWLSVDCGEDDGDGFERKELDALENTMHSHSGGGGGLVVGNKEVNTGLDFADVRQSQLPVKAPPRLPERPVELRSIDLRIINFAKSHPVLWRKSADPEFNSIDDQTRKSLWLNFWKSAPKKQASDDEDNEIEIVEPKRDTITIDSDEEAEADELPSTSTAALAGTLKITAVTSAAGLEKPHEEENLLMPLDIAEYTSSILASMLEVDITEGKQKKQPRKKTTNKRNPALIQIERKRMEEMKRTDAKLNMRVVVKLRRAEDEFPVARKWVEEQARKAKKSRTEKLRAESLYKEKTVEAKKLAEKALDKDKAVEKEANKEPNRDSNETNDEPMEVLRVVLTEELNIDLNNTDDEPMEVTNDSENETKTERAKDDIRQSTEAAEEMEVLEASNKDIVTEGEVINSDLSPMEAESEVAEKENAEAESDIPEINEIINETEEIEAESEKMDEPTAEAENAVPEKDETIDKTATNITEGNVQELDEIIDKNTAIEVEIEAAEKNNENDESKSVGDEPIKNIVNDEPANTKAENDTNDLIVESIVGKLDEAAKEPLVEANSNQPLLKSISTDSSVIVNEEDF